MDENYKFAVEGRQTHLKAYHYWMNMYAIINGALFVGLYNVVDKDSDYITFGILILGCLAGWFWHLSVKGFHTWMISWIKNIQRFEENYGVYRVFCNVKVEKDKPITPLSTPKLTKAFTFGVAFVWSILVLLHFYKINKEFIDSLPMFEKNQAAIKFGGLLLIIILLVIFIVLSGIKLCKESDLRKTNTVIDSF